MPILDIKQQESVNNNYYWEKYYNVFTQHVYEEKKECQITKNSKLNGNSF